MTRTILSSFLIPFYLRLLAAVNLIQTLSTTRTDRRKFLALHPSYDFFGFTVHDVIPL